MGKNSKDLYDKLDTTMMIARAAIEEHGEDSFCSGWREHVAMIGVFDGCGGLGSRTYPGFRDHTGAYIAARSVSGSVYDWFEQCGERMQGSSDGIAVQIRKSIEQGFRRLQPYAEGCLKMRGSMVRDFPTTAAIAVIHDTKNGIQVRAVWAGDSRVYILDENGLAQISEDDLDRQDAFSNLSDDGELTNVIAADGKYELHEKVIHLSRPAIVFAATDGCFGYMNSPMVFEYTILDALERAKTPRELKKNLGAELSAYAGDDLTLGMAAFDFGTFVNMKRVLKKRYEMMDARYISRMQEANDYEQLEEMWQEYRKEYERYL